MSAVKSETNVSTREDDVRNRRTFLINVRCHGDCRLRLAVIRSTAEEKNTVNMRVLGVETLILEISLLTVYLARQPAFIARK